MGAWGSNTLPLGQAESQGLERSSQGGFWPPGKGSGSECEDASEVEGQDAKETEKILSPGELSQLPGQGLIWEEEWISEVTEKEEHSAPHRRKGRSHNKRRNSGEKASEGELQGHSQGSSSSSNSL